ARGRARTLRRRRSRPRDAAPAGRRAESRPCSSDLLRWWFGCRGGCAVRKRSREVSMDARRGGQISPRDPGTTRVFVACPGAPWQTGARPPAPSGSSMQPDPAPSTSRARRPPEWLVALLAYLVVFAVALWGWIRSADIGEPLGYLANIEDRWLVPWIIG